MLKFFNKFNRFFSIVGVISSIFLIILIALIGLFFLLKKISVSKSDQYRMVTQNLIHKSSLNFGQLNPEDSIKIYFHKDMVDDSQIGVIESEPLLSLSPRVDGELFWINKRTLNFKPKKSLSNKKYDVKIDIHRLLDFATHIKSKKDFPKKLSVPLTVIQQGVDQFKYRWENTGSKQGDVKLDADLVFNLPIDLSLLRDGMKVIKSKQTVDFKLEKVDDKGHRFKLVSDTITRTNKKEELTITIDIPKHDFNHSLKAYTDPMVGFHATRIHTVNDNLKSYIKIDFSDPIKKNQDIRGLINVENLTDKDKLTFNIVNNSVIVNGPFEPGKNYDVYILSGIQNTFDQKTSIKKMFSISFQHRDSSLRFLHDGMILPSSNQSKVLFESLNLKRVTLTIWKAHDSFFNFKNLEALSNSNSFSFFEFYRYYINDFKSGKDNHRFNYRIGTLTKVISQTLELDSVSNSWLLNEIDITDFLNSKYNEVQKGLYVIQLSFSKSDIIAPKNKLRKYDDYFLDNNKIIKPIIFSDISLTVKETDTDYLVYVTDIVTGKPIPNVPISTFNFYYEGWRRDSLELSTINSLNSNEDGLVTLSKKYLNHGRSRYDKSLVVVAEHQDSFALIDLFNNKWKDSHRWNLSTFSTGGINQQPVQAFMYTDRGVYRPGSPIHLSVILRDNIYAKKSTSSFPNKVPIKLVVKNPKGQVVHEAINKDGSNGFYSFEIPTKVDAMTGTWKAVLSYAKSSFSTDIKVETIVPYKLKINTDFSKKALSKENFSTTINIKSHYLAGSPAKNNPVKIKLSKFNVAKTFKNYPNFSFINTTNELSASEETMLDSTLNENGEFVYQINFTEASTPPSMITGKVITEVLERGGRPVRKVDLISYDPYESYIGIQDLGDSRYSLNEAIRINSIYLSKDGSPIKNQTLTYTIYKNETFWWWEFLRKNEQKLKFKSNSATFLVDEGTFTTGVKPKQIEFIPKENGVYLIEISGAQRNSHISSQFFGVGYSYDSNREDASSIILKPEKETYFVNETAQLSFPAPPNSKALVTIEKGSKVLKSEWISIDKNSIEGTYEFDVTNDMIPNVYVSVSVIQPHLNLDNDLPIRTFGIAPILVQSKDQIDNFTISAPKEIRPNSNFSIEFKSQYNQKTQFTVAIVDEGLLDITDFKTPNPLSYFNQKERLNIMTYDLFSDVIGINKGDIFKTFSIGGADALQKRQQIASKLQRFKPVALFKGPIETNSKGYAKVDFEMPNYIGSVRVMAISANNNQYGNNDRTISVNSPLSIISSMPRTVKTGDTFEYLATIFTNSNDNISANLKLETSDNLELISKNQELISLSKDNEAVVKYVFNVKNDVGVGAIQLMVSSTLNSKKESFTDSKDFQIKSPVPYIAKINRSKSQILKNGGLLEWVLPKSFTQGTDVASLSISSIPELSIGHRVESLIRYPYGCIEQTTSSVFPQLYLADVMEGLNKSKIDENINAGIKRLTKFVTSSGGFSYWPGQNWPSLWGSNYAGHFLIIAKRNGYFVPQSMYDGLLNYHANNLRTGGLLTRVYRLYLLSLANKPQIGALNQIYHSEFAQLSNQSKWLLAAAYKLAGNTKVASEIAEKSDLKVVQFSENNYSYGSVLRDKAIILNSLIDLSDAEIPDYEIKRKRVLEDIAKELGSNEWLSTQTLGYSLLAVGRYATERTLEQPVNVNIKFPELDKEKNVKITRTVNDISILKGYGQPIVVSLDSNEPLYAQLNWEGVPDVMKIKELSNGLKINRKFLDDLGNEIKISSLDRGDSFWVHYQIKKKKDTSLEELALNQIIPSGWEIDNSRLSQSALPDWTNKLEIGKEEYLDIRDDSISWFFDMNRSTKSLDFILKVNVVTPGEFILAPTVAEAMYDNTFKAILPTQKVVVK